MSNYLADPLDLSIEELETMDSPVWDAVVGVCISVALNLIIT